MSGHVDGVGSSDPYDFGIADYEAFMTEYRYNICHIVEVEKAFPWLRHRGVLDESDQQLIMNQFHTNCLRTGHMVDTLLKRGKRGCDALMEHIEYDYPEHFQKFTGREPRQPNTEKYFASDYKPLSTKYRPNSAIILEQLVNINQKIVQTYVEERERLRSLEESLRQLTGRVQDFQKEVDMKNEQISELSQKNLELKEQYKSMQHNWEYDKKEKIQCIEECEKLRKAKDEAQEKCNQILAEKGQAARASVKQSSMKDQNRNKLQQENAVLRQELESYKNGTCMITQNADDCMNDTIKRQKSTIAELIKEKGKLQNEKDNFQDQIDNLNEMSFVYETNINELKLQLELTKQERDNVLSKVHECTRTCETLQKRNTSLSRQVSDVSSELRQMKQEADASHRELEQLNGSPDNLYAYIDEVEPPRIPSVYSDTDTDDDDATDGSPPATQPWRGRNKQHIKRYASCEPDTSLLCSTRPEGTALLRRVKKRAPLVLFAPKELRNDIQQKLLKTDGFSQCPIEKQLDSSILEDWLDQGSCVHIEKVGREYHCLATKTLHECLKQDSGRLLLCVPPEAVVRLHRQKINPLLLLVKYRDLEDRGVKSCEELELQKFQDLQFGKVLVEKDDDLDSIVKAINIKCSSLESTKPRSNEPSFGKTDSSTSV